MIMDKNGKNGTVYNKKDLEAGIRGRIKPVLLSDGDVFVFGGGDEEVINCQTVWAMFSTNYYEDSWRVVDTKGWEKMIFECSEGTTRLENPDKGTVVEKKDGIAIYMGNITYLAGDMELVAF